MLRRLVRDTHGHRCEAEEIQRDSIKDHHMASKGTIIITGASQGIGAGLAQVSAKCFGLIGN